jgi:hypothetical protein
MTTFQWTSQTHQTLPEPQAGSPASSRSVAGQPLLEAELETHGGPPAATVNR